MRWKSKATLAIVIVVAIVLAGLVYLDYLHSDLAPSGSAFSVVNLTQDLGNQFTPGSIQAFGVNSSSLLISGVGLYNKTTDYSLPNLMKMTSLSPSVQGTNMDLVANQYFRDGNVFGTGWNGSSWLLTGQISWGNITEGAVVSISGSLVTNLTSILSRYFVNGGIWFDGWNGSAWLLGGNSDKKASLVSYHNGKVTDETGLLGSQVPNAWIQWLEWNGSSWLVGGHGVFGFLNGNYYINMLGESPFNSSGVLSSDFHNREWVIGGGPPATIIVLSGTHITGTIHMPRYFDEWVNSIVYYRGVYLIGGKGLNPNGSFHPALYFLDLNVVPESVENLTHLLPSSFDFGQVQFMSYVTLDGESGVLIAGQGYIDPNSGYSRGALAILS